MIGESSGLARAFGPGSTIACCCGTHWTARRCRCPDCPVVARGRQRPAAGDRFAAEHDCDGAGNVDPGVLTVSALPVAAAPPSAAPPFAGALPPPAIPVRPGRAVDVDRPPP